MELIFSVDEIQDNAKKIAQQKLPKIIVFDGKMGAGKTTLIKHIVAELGVIDTISSPTFSLVNEYQTSENKIIYHFDLYRLKNQIEAFDMGIEDYLYSGNQCFVEWPDLISDLIPKNHAVISIEVLEDQRRRIKLKLSE